MIVLRLILQLTYIVIRTFLTQFLLVIISIKIWVLSFISYLIKGPWSLTLYIFFIITFLIFIFFEQ